MIDLHVHTTCSDGSYTPDRIVAEAVRKGINVLAITDHDSIDAIPDAIAASGKAGITFVSGVELTVYHDEREVHILGYFIDVTQNWLKELLDVLRTHRMERMKRMMEIMAGLGKPVTMEQVRGDGSGSIGRPHLARALVNSGACGSVDEVFRTYLAPGRPAYVRKFMLSAQDGIEIIKKAGGISVMAHPGIVACDEIIFKAHGWGLDGLEVFHSDHSAAQTQYYKELAEKEGLLMTGGSDFHGERVRSRSTLGYPPVPNEIYQKMIDYRRRAPD